MFRRFAIALLALAIVSPDLAAAQPWEGGGRAYGRSEQDAARDGVRSGRRVPLGQVLATIAARNPGRHLDASPGEAGGRPVYYVQWQFPDGQVVIFVVDAESGVIIGRQGG
jgi:uncharacterized membrane protein YkoI